MSLTLHNTTIAGVVQILGAMSAVLDKAEAFCEAKKIEPAVIGAWRLAPDMFTFARQIQIMSDIAKGGAARLAEMEPPAWEDTETTIVELKTRIARTLDFIAAIPADKYVGAEDRTVVLKLGGQEMSFTGLDYAVKFVIPNVYFHATAAYAILRQCGVEIGKRDFLGA